MADNFIISMGRNMCHGAVLLLLVNMSFPAAASSPTSPSQIAALSFAYHSMTAHTCGPDAATLRCAAREQRLAIIRADYHALPNGTASVWMELLAQPQATSHIPAPITRTTVELKLLSNPEGNLATTAQRTLTSETWKPDTDIQEALAETRLRGLVYRWLMLFEQPDRDATALLAHTLPSTILDPAAGPRLTGQEQIGNWLTTRRQRQKKVRQQAEVIDIVLLAPRRYRLDFAVNWQGRGTDGALRIGRKEYRWKVELGTDGEVRITHIQERDALPLPNMGTRIFC